MQSFSNRLIALRKERGLTQAELAGLVHLQRSTLSGYETEGKEPSYETLCRLAEFFDVTTDYLLGVSSARTHNDAVFINDTNNFAACFNQAPAQVKSTVVACFDNFYLLLSKDIKQQNMQRLKLYAELSDVVQKYRASIRTQIEFGKRTDPMLLANLMTEQSNFKNEVAVLLDRLMQADMGVIAQEENLELSEKSAM